MEDFDQKGLEDLLDNMGLPKPKEQPVSNITYDPNVQHIVAVEVPDVPDEIKLKRRKSIFKPGALIVTRNEINGYLTRDYKETIVDTFAQAAGQVGIPEKTALMVLQEGIVRTSYGPASGVYGGKKGSAEVCYRFLKALSVDVKGRPAYYTVLINPDLNEVGLQAFFDFPEEVVIKTNSDLTECNITPEIEKRLEIRKQKILDKMLTNTKRISKNGKQSNR
jgi:hypothetical protein